MTKEEPLYYFMNAKDGLRIRCSQEKVIYQYFSQNRYEPVREALLGKGGQFQTHRNQWWRVSDFEPELDAFYTLRNGKVGETTHLEEIS